MTSIMNDSFVTAIVVSSKRISSQISWFLLNHLYNVCGSYLMLNGKSLWATGNGQFVVPPLLPFPPPPPPPPSRPSPSPPSVRSSPPPPPTIILRTFFLFYVWFSSFFFVFVWVINVNALVSIQFSQRRSWRWGRRMEEESHWECKIGRRSNRRRKNASQKKSKTNRRNVKRHHTVSSVISPCGFRSVRGPFIFLLGTFRLGYDQVSVLAFIIPSFNGNLH